MESPLHPPELGFRRSDLFCLRPTMAQAHEGGAADDEFAFVPFLDMTNHDAEPNADFSCEGGRYLLRALRPLNQVTSDVRVSLSMSVCLSACLSVCLSQSSASQPASMSVAVCVLARVESRDAKHGADSSSFRGKRCS